MGLFTDRCETLVDPTTRRALWGEALARARKDPAAERCGNKMPKAARFCNKCGGPVSGGWRKCTGCGKWVGAEANFCWNCKTPLFSATNISVADGQPPGAGMFARRVPAADMVHRLKTELQVDAGTVALLLEDGVIKEVLKPGRHTVETLGRRAQAVLDGRQSAALLVDAGDVVLPLRFNGLRSQDELAIECYTEVSFRFVPEQGEAFIANVLKAQNDLSYEKLADWLRQELRGAVSDLTQSAAVGELVKDPERRLRLEDALRKALAAALPRAGLELIRVASVEFTGAEYEALRAAAGQIEVKRREIEFQQRLRELTSAGEMDRFKSEQDLAEYINQLAQEKAVSTALRDQELVRLKQVQRHEVDRAEADYRMASEIEAAAHQIRVKIPWNDYTRDKLLKDAAVQAKVKAIEADEQVRQSFEWLKVRAEKQRVDLEAEKAKAQLYAGQDIKTLIALLPDGKQRADLLELYRQTSAASLTPEQMLAAAAANSPDAAAALAKIRDVKREDLEREFKDRKALTDESAAKLERVLTEALKAMGSTNAWRGGPNNLTVNNS